MRVGKTYSAAIQDTIAPHSLTLNRIHPVALLDPERRTHLTPCHTAPAALHSTQGLQGACHEGRLVLDVPEGTTILRISAVRVRAAVVAEIAQAVRDQLWSNS